MSPDELSYYRHRAVVERAHAAAATNPYAVEIHQKLACLYEKLIELEDEKPTLRIVTPERLSA